MPFGRHPLKMVCLPISPLPLAWESMLSITNSPARSEVRPALEVFGKCVETVKLEQALRGHRLREMVVLQHPGVGMMHVDGVKTDSDRWVDIGTRAVADHPRGLWHKRIPCDDLAIGIGVLLRRDLNSGEVH